MNIDISVVLPIYNTGDYLKKCLDSLINQTFKNVEFICVDDGSSDNSLKYLEEYSREDCRIKIITQKNMGAGAARNNGYLKTSGKYVIFLDSDDEYYPEMLEKMYNQAVKTQADFVITKYDIKNLKTNRFEKNKGFKHIDKEVFNRNDISKIFEFATVVPWNKLYKKEFIEKYDLKFTETRISNDISFVLQTFFLADTISKVEESLLVHNFCNETSLTSARGKYIDDVACSHEEIYNFLLKHSFMEQYETDFKALLFGNYIYNFSFKSNKSTLSKLKQNIFNTKHFELIMNMFQDKYTFFVDKYKKYLLTNILTLFLIPPLKRKYSFYKNVKTNIESLVIESYCFDKNQKDYPIRLSAKERDTLIKYVKQSKQYLEFGSGGSTFLTICNSDAKIYSVESDISWIYYLRNWEIIKKAEKDNNLYFQYINIGKTGAWGKPINDSCQELYPNYSEYIFKKLDKIDIDTVFIDGRFRVACVLSAILYYSGNTTILIHDYENREYYHIVEEFLSKTYTADTLAVFTIKKDINIDKVKTLYEKYKYIAE